ncbi:hypothetical protein [Allocoleopsis sp.]|uniref:hypothetical protein n=1 Tax=Allocoleopsis sp. TaxID=3088169 RepID=UPI002FD0747D
MSVGERSQILSCRESNMTGLAIGYHPANSKEICTVMRFPDCAIALVQRGENNPPVQKG